ncbi:hypothetical protein PCANB_001400 [Pneumocystis canis]|nr:hypothetical protein PCANB_001400 [Pneumocystis canis]
MGRKLMIMSKKAGLQKAISHDSVTNEQDDSVDELAFSVKSKKKTMNKETPLRKVSSMKKMDSSEKENRPLRSSSTIRSVHKKELFEKNIAVEKDLKNNQKESVRQDVLQVQLNDSKRKFIDIYDNSISVDKRLEEATRKMEEYEKRYKCLKDLRQTEVELNFLAYREAAESRFKVSQALIDSLTEDIDAKDKKLNDLLLYMNDFKAKKQEFEKLSEKLKSTEQALSRANSRISYLNSKLSSRSNASIVQLKEELYSDLTGLLIRDVKSDSKKTVFDCLQTGRNGTLHFKLSLFADPSCQSQERFSYTPLFNEERDASLLNCLPDYLTDEIIFEKDQAAISRLVSYVSEIHPISNLRYIEYPYDVTSPLSVRLHKRRKDILKKGQIFWENNNIFYFKKLEMFCNDIVKKKGIITDEDMLAFYKEYLQSSKLKMRKYQWWWYRQIFGILVDSFKVWINNISDHPSFFFHIRRKEQ